MSSTLLIKLRLTMITWYVHFLIKLDSRCIWLRQLIVCLEFRFHLYLYLFILLNFRPFKCFIIRRYFCSELWRNIWDKHWFRRRVEYCWRFYKTLGICFQSIQSRRRKGSMIQHNRNRRGISNWTNFYLIALNHLLWRSADFYRIIWISNRKVIGWTKRRLFLMSSNFHFKNVQFFLNFLRANIKGWNINSWALWIRFTTFWITSFYNIRLNIRLFRWSN